MLFVLKTIRLVINWFNMIKKEIAFIFQKRFVVLPIGGSSGGFP